MPQPGTCQPRAGQEKRRQHHQHPHRAVVVAEVHRRGRKLPGLGVELIGQEDAAREMQADLSCDPGKRHEHGGDCDSNPEAVVTARRREGGSPLACSRDRERERQDDAERGYRVHRPGVEVAGVDDPRPGHDGTQCDRGSAHVPGAPRKCIKGEERERDRGAGDRRKVELDERAAQTSLEPRPRHVVDVARIDDGVDDEDREHVGGEQRPDGESLALGRAAAHHSSAALSASATYAWSSSASRVWNGSASVRALAASATGHRPSRKP